jgi:hypothetical protein
MRSYIVNVIKEKGEKKRFNAYSLMIVIIVSEDDLCPTVKNAHRSVRWLH